MAEHLLRLKDMAVQFGRRLTSRDAVVVEKSVVPEPKVLYEHDGILVVQLTRGRSIELQMVDDERINTAFRNAGIEPSLAIQLVLGHLSGSSAHEENQFADEEHIIQTEHVVERTATTRNGEVKVYDVGYFPAAARHAEDDTIGVHTRDCELILGISGMGMLEIAPVTNQDNGWIARREEMTRVPIKENTLAILPPNKQGNRWKFFDEGTLDTPGLEVTYAAYPGPYDSSTVKQANIQ